jgi:hypothetical protein
MDEDAHLVGAEMEEVSEELGRAVDWRGGCSELELGGERSEPLLDLEVEVRDFVGVEFLAGAAAAADCFPDFGA